MVDQSHGAGLRWNGLPARLTFGQIVFGLWVTLLVAVALYSIWRLAPHDESVSLLGETRLSPSGIRQMEVALANAGLNDYRKEQGEILVPHSRRAEYLQALKQHGGLPKEWAAKLPDSNGISAFVPPSVRKEQSDRQWAVGVAGIIEQMPGVASAEVFFDERVEEGFPPRRQRVVSVAVMCEKNYELSPQQVNSIREMVGGSRAGLNSSDITISDIMANRTIKGDQQWQFDAAPLELARYNQRIEDHWQQKIQKVLSHIEGVKVAVAASTTELPSRPEILGTPDRLALTISVPKTHLDRLYMRRAVGKTLSTKQARALFNEVQDQTQREIRGLVDNLFTAGTALAGIQILTHESTAGAPVWDANLALQQLQSADFWRRYGMIAVAAGLLGLTVLGHSAWSFLSGRESGSAITSEPTLSVYGTDPRGRRETEQVSGEDDEVDSDSREQLVRIVRHDPSRAAQVLKEWIREAG